MIIDMLHCVTIVLPLMAKDSSTKLPSPRFKLVPTYACMNGLDQK